MPVAAYYSTDAGAPRLSGTAGDLLNLLRKCLIDGYGAKAPQGSWEGFFSANGLKGAFRSVDPGATGIWLHVDDSASVTPQSALTRGWEQLTGLDANGDPVDGVGMFPSIVQQATFALKKSQSSDTVSRPWVVIAEERCFYILVDPASNTNLYGHFPYFFGDVVSVKPGDMFHCLACFGSSTSNGGASSSHGSELERIWTGSGYVSPQPCHWVARRFDQTGGAVQGGKGGDTLVVSGGVMGYGTGFPYPNPADGSLVIAPLIFYEAGNGLRGTMPGLFQPLHNKPLANYAKIENPVGLAGRTLQAFYTWYSSPGEILIDLTGPWR